MVQYPQKCDTEVWGLLVGDAVDGEITIDDIKMFGHKQSSGARAEPDYMEMQRWMMENEDIIGSQFERMMGWYHTHIGIPPRPSTIDDETINRI